MLLPKKLLSDLPTSPGEHQMFDMPFTEQGLKARIAKMESSKYSIEVFFDGAQQGQKTLYTGEFAPNEGFSRIEEELMKRL
jgi:hypothetical protein